jgi:teichuronic acid biosynthesis protein TuaE
MIKILVFISIIASMIGSASILAIDLGVIQLSLFRVSILLLLLYMTIKILIMDKKIRINNISANGYSIKFMFIWVVYAFFSLGWVKDYNSWIRAMFFLCTGLVVYIIYSIYLISKYDVLKVFKVISIMVLIHNVLGWYEINTGNYLFLSVDKIAKYSRLSHPVSAFGNTNDFSTFMLFSFWVTYICLVNSRTYLMKIINLLLMISSVLLIISTASRANLLGLLLSVMILIVLYIKRKRATNTLLVLLFLLGVVFVIVLLNPVVVNSIFVSVNENLNFNFSSEGGSDSVRINLIKNGLSFLISTFGFGVGAGNIEHWMSHETIYSTGGVFNLHNWWLEILVGYGLIIFVMYLVFYVKLFKNIYRKFKYSTNKMDISISLGIICFMVGYVIGSISSSSNISSEWLWVFWGIAIAYQGIEIDSI